MPCSNPSSIPMLGSCAGGGEVWSNSISVYRNDPANDLSPGATDALMAEAIAACLAIPFPPDTPGEFRSFRYEWNGVDYVIANTSSCIAQYGNTEPPPARAVSAKNRSLGPPAIGGQVLVTKTKIYGPLIPICLETVTQENLLGGIFGPNPLNLVQWNCQPIFFDPSSLGSETLNTQEREVLPPSGGWGEDGELAGSEILIHTGTDGTLPPPCNLAP